MYKLKKKNGKLLTSKYVGTGPSSFKKKIIYEVAVLQRLRNTALKYLDWRVGLVVICFDRLRENGTPVSKHIGGRYIS